MRIPSSPNMGRYFATPLGDGSLREGEMLPPAKEKRDVRLDGEPGLRAAALPLPAGRVARRCRHWLPLAFPWGPERENFFAAGRLCRWCDVVSDEPADSSPLASCKSRWDKATTESPNPIDSHSRIARIYTARPVVDGWTNRSLSRRINRCAGERYLSDVGSYTVWLVAVPR